MTDRRSPASSLPGSTVQQEATVKLHGSIVVRGQWTVGEWTVKLRGYAHEMRGFAQFLKTRIYLS